MGYSCRVCGEGTFDWLSSDYFTALQGERSTCRKLVAVQMMPDKGSCHLIVRQLISIGKNDNPPNPLFVGY